MSTCPTSTLDMTSLTTSGGSYSEQSKMSPQTASGGISREKFMRGSHNCTGLSGINGPTNGPDMTSIVASGRLQNAI